MILDEAIKRTNEFDSYGVWTVADATSSRNSLGTIVNWNTGSYSLHGYYASLPF